MEMKNTLHFNYAYMMELLLHFTTFCHKKQLFSISTTAKILGVEAIAACLLMHCN